MEVLSNNSSDNKLDYHHSVSADTSFTSCLRAIFLAITFEELAAFFRAPSWLHTMRFFTAQGLCGVFQNMCEIIISHM